MKNPFSVLIANYRASTFDMPAKESQSIDSSPFGSHSYAIPEKKSRWAKVDGTKTTLYMEVADGHRRYGQFVVWNVNEDGGLTKSFHEAEFGLAFGQGM